MVVVFLRYVESDIAIVASDETLKFLQKQNVSILDPERRLQASRKTYAHFFFLKQTSTKSNYRSEIEEPQLAYILRESSDKFEIK